MNGLINALRAPVFRRVWAGQMANMIGDAAFGVAIALYLLPRSDAPRALGIVLGATALGGVVSLLVGGALADRYRRSRIIMASDALRAIMIAGILLVGATAPLWLLGGFAALLGIGSGLYRPAYSAILPSLVPEESIAGANALRSFGSRAAAFVGASVGGVLAAALSPTVVLIIDIVTFLASIASVIGVPDDKPGGDSKPVSLPREIGDGLRYVFERPWMAGVMLQGTVQIALVAAPVALMLPLVVGENGSWYGWIVAIEAVGAFLGATIGAAVKTASRGWLAMLALLCQLPQILALAFQLGPVALLVTSLLAGVGLSVFGVVWTTALHTGVPREKLGRVFSVDAVATQGLRPVGYVAAGLLLGALGTATVAWTAAIVLVISVAAVLPLRGLRHLGVPQRINEPLPTGPP